MRRGTSSPDPLLADPLSAYHGENAGRQERGSCMNTEKSSPPRVRSFDHEWRHALRMAYVRGPEGIIVSLAESVG